MTELDRVLAEIRAKEAQGKKPTLEEIFGTQQKPSLDEIFNGSQPRRSPDEIYNQVTQTNPYIQTNPYLQGNGQQRPTLGEIFGDATLQPPPVVPAGEKTWLDTALEYLDKPSGAVAGATQYVAGVGKDENILDAAVRGWKTNADYKPILDQTEWAKEHPTLAEVANVGGKIVADPLWFVTPAKVVKGAKALMGAEAVADAGKAIRNSEIVQKVANTAEEVGSKEVGGLSVKRWVSETGPLDEELDALKRAQAMHTEKIGVVAKEVSQSPEEVRKLITEYVEASPDIGKFAKPVDLLQEHKAVNALNGIDEVSNVRRSQVLEKAKAAGMDEKAVDQLYQLGEKSASLMDEYTSELAKRGILSPETAAKFEGGRHIRHEYMKYVDPEEHLRLLRETGQVLEADTFSKAMENLQKYADKKGYKLNLKAVTERQNLPQDIQDKLGRIYDATHPLAKGGQISADLMNKYDFLKSVADKHGSAKPGLGLYELRGKAFGPLEGKHVPRGVYNEVNKVIKELTEPEKWWRKAVAYWKVGKTILNPATHARNFMSNAVLLNIGGVPFQKIPTYLAKAANELHGKGEIYNEARNSSNFLLNTFSQNEIGNILNKTKNPGIVGQGVNIAKGIVDKAGDIYQANENVGKLAAYMYAKDMGKTAQEAAKFADDVLFNYSKVPPIVDWMRKSGAIPFASFPYFSMKAVGKAMYEHPAKVTKYFQPMESMQSNDEKTLMPKWMDPKYQLPIGQTTRMVNGKPMPANRYLDVKYMYPFESEFGLSPVLGIASALQTNKDPFSKQDIAKPGMTKAQQNFALRDYIYKALAPSFAPPLPGVSDGGYSWRKVADAINGIPDKKGNFTTTPEALAATVLGLRTNTMNIDEAAKGRIDSIRHEQQEIAKEIRKVMTDKRLSPAEKKAKRDQYTKEMKELQAEGKAVVTARDRLKKSGNKILNPYLPNSPANQNLQQPKQNINPYLPNPNNPYLKK